MDVRLFFLGLMTVKTVKIRSTSIELKNKIELFARRYYNATSICVITMYLTSSGYMGGGDATDESSLFGP